jgi:leucyl aminopeptidase
MLRFVSGDVSKLKTDAFIIPVAEDALLHENGQIMKLVEKSKAALEFKGAKGDELTLYNLPDLKAPRLIFLGLGKKDKIDTESFRAVCGKAVKKCTKNKLKKILITVPSQGAIGMDLGDILEPMMEGAFLGNHIFDRYKEEKKIRPLDMICFFAEQQVASDFHGLLQHVETICSGVILAREWVNTPSNFKRPEIFAKNLISPALKENLSIRNFDHKRLERLGFGALMAVGAGSRYKPRFVALKYSPKGAEKKVALVGKGITFDSGGINLKPPGSLEDMKMDMSGAAAVAATLISVARFKPSLEITGIIPIAENMPSGDASRPGDIIKSYSGKTIEINNTDAEGRLILADAISFVLKEERPDVIIDMATLTGACVVALGEKIAGVFSPDDELAGKILESAKKTGERCWRMPLPEDYREYLKSEFADISNMSSSKYGGAITAALFLSEFVKDAKWAHIDIAGPAYVKKETDYCGVGGTGFGVRLLCDLIQKL